MRESGISGVAWYIHGKVEICDLPIKFEASITFKDLGDVIQVDHDLDGVGRVLLAGLDFDDDSLFIVRGDEVGLAGLARGRSLWPEAVLALDRYGVSAVFPLRPLLVDESGVAGEPLGLVEVGGDSGPPVVLGLEPAEPAHSQEFLPACSVGSQMAKMYG